MELTSKMNNNQFNPQWQVPANGNQPGYPQTLPNNFQPTPSQPQTATQQWAQAPNQILPQQQVTNNPTTTVGSGPQASNISIIVTAVLSGVAVIVGAACLFLFLK